MICISVGQISKFREISDLQPSLVEVRYDLVRKDPTEVAGLLSDTILQVATCRPGAIPDRERADLLMKAITLGAVYVDIEIESPPWMIREIASHAQKHSCHLILSYHNFSETPSADQLLQVLADCYSAGADVAKIACQVNGPADAARLLSLYAEGGRKIVVGMGEGGRITRLAALELGAEFTFAAVNENDVTAPGQIAYHDLLALKNKLH